MRTPASGRTFVKKRERRAVRALCPGGSDSLKFYPLLFILEKKCSKFCVGDGLIAGKDELES